MFGQRVENLEKRMDRVEGKLDVLSHDVAEMKGKLSQMPTTFQMVSIVAAIMGAAVAFLKLT